MSRRDEFLVNTKRTLAARAGHRCSFPGCSQVTSGPSAEGDDKAVNVGEACHIRAAASGRGARRYDSSMSSDERKDISNGIWMCRTHAKLIDSDEATYTVEQLEQWKEDAEQRAERRLRGGSFDAFQAGRIYGMAHSPSPKFVGREMELRQLENLLTTSQAIRVSASIEGLPGIGKTELALQLVVRLARDGVFPGGIFWFNAENPDLVSSWGGKVADGLGIAKDQPLEERCAAVLRHISTRSEPVLLVLDNVEIWSADQQPAPLPQGGHVYKLVTTRQRSLGGGHFEHVDVGFLDEASTRRLVQEISGRELDGTPGFDDLIQYLDGHALASELAGAFLSAFPHETPATYLAELATNPDVEEEVRNDVRYRRTVEQAFETLWRRLSEESQDAWRLAACFEPEPVTVELSDAVGLDSAARRRLSRLHLIEVGDDGRWWMHRLTRDFGEQRREEGDLQQFVEGCTALADHIELADGFRIYVPNRAQFETALIFAPSIFEPADGKISNFQDRIAAALLSMGDLRRARDLRKQALASDLDNLGEDHPSVATRRSNLALVLQDLGDLPAARKLLEQALASAMNNLGEDHPSVATSRSNLALVLKALGDLPAAKKLLEQALASAMDNLGEDHPSVATRRSNLALVLKDLGDLPAAKKLLEQALASDLNNLGEDHPTVAIRRFNLAMVFKEAEDFASAHRLFEQALQSEEKMLGPGHPSLALTQAQLATMQHELGETETAARTAGEALAAVADQPEGSRFRTQVERITAPILTPSTDA